MPRYLIMRATVLHWLAATAIESHADVESASSRFRVTVLALRGYIEQWLELRPVRVRSDALLHLSIDSH